MPVYFEAAVLEISGVLRLLPLVRVDGRGGFDGVVGAVDRFLGSDVLVFTAPLIVDGGT